MSVIFILTSGYSASTKNLLWISGKGHKTGGEIHSHNHCRIAYVKEEGNSSPTKVINSNEIEVLVNL